MVECREILPAAGESRMSSEPRYSLNIYRYCHHSDLSVVDQRQNSLFMSVMPASLTVQWTLWFSLVPEHYLKLRNTVVGCGLQSVFIAPCPYVVVQFPWRSSRKPLPAKIIWAYAFTEDVSATIVTSSKDTDAIFKRVISFLSISNLFGMRHKSARTE